MKDIWENTIVCNKCNCKVRKVVINKEDFSIRTWQCPKCGKEWYHPVDSNRYLQWKKLKNEKFKVKLRQVGNSFTISIPKQIVDFEELKIGEEGEWGLEKPNKLTFYLNEN